MNKTLSILIVSLKSRKHLLNRLSDVLKPQMTPEVEVLVSLDEKQSSIGSKRNGLLRQAQGKYVSFVDDDDLVSSDYINKILNAATNNSDCIGIEGVITLKEFGPRVFIHSLKYKEWFEKDGIYYRNPNHLNPIKRDIALSVGFPNISNQEDKVFSYNIQSKLRTETYIETPIYYYYPSSEGQ